MAQIAQLLARRADRIGMFALLLVLVPVRAASAADPSPNVSISPTPWPKVELQTVGAGPRFLTAQEEQKRAALTTAPSVLVRSTTRPDGTSRLVPWSPKSAFKRETDFSTFFPIPGFGARAFAEKARPFPVVRAAPVVSLIGVPPVDLTTRDRMIEVAPNRG